MGDKAGAQKGRNMREHYSLNTEFGAADEFFGAIMTLDKKRVKELRANGITLTENVRSVLENGSGKKQNTRDPAVDLYFDFIRELKETPVGEIAEKLALLRAETAKPLYFSETLWFWGNKRCFEPKLFGAVLDAFNQKQMSKKKTMQKIIDENALGCLTICEKNGWLKNPKTRDELIKYANENSRTECSAWLLDFKNRTADLAAEQARAEKKMLRELNADPNSLTELRKIWSFEKTADGNVMITGYKGAGREITVPKKLHGDTVTAIGDHAFSPSAKRIRAEQRALRKAITKITLPDTIESIGEFAFFKCESLMEINIPGNLTEISRGMLNITGVEHIVIGGNVKRIGAVAFWGCRELRYVKLCEGVCEIDEAAFYLCGGLEIVELPHSLEKIADFTMSANPFHGCHKLTALVHKGSYAEKYCMENNIVYKYTEE